MPSRLRSLIDRTKNRSRYKPSMTELEAGGEEEENNPAQWDKNPIDLGLSGVTVRRVTPIVDPPEEYRPLRLQKIASTPDSTPASPETTKSP